MGSVFVNGVEEERAGQSEGPTTAGQWASFAPRCHCEGCGLATSDLQPVHDATGEPRALCAVCAAAARDSR